MTPDRMSQAATNAAQALLRLDFKLHAAASMELTREQRADYVRQSFRQFRGVIRAMTDLEGTAPKASSLGYEDDDRARDFIEAREHAA